MQVLVPESKLLVFQLFGPGRTNDACSRCSFGGPLMLSSLFEYNSTSHLVRIGVRDVELKTPLCGDEKLKPCESVEEDSKVFEFDGERWVGQ